MKNIFTLIYCLCCSLSIYAQGVNGDSVCARCVDDGLEVAVEMQSSVSDGITPLWLNANKYGLSSLESSNGYLRASAVRPLSADYKSRRFDLAYGLDMALAYNYTSSVVVQQAFLEGRWLKGVLTVGSKEWKLEQKNNELSSGGQTFGRNARPVPQVRAALADWWTMPVLNDWLQIKGHLAYGCLTDDKWEQDFTGKTTKYTENTLYQSKAGYLKIGKEDAGCPLTVTLGVETASLFGGTSYMPNEFGEMVGIKNCASLNAFWHAFFPGGADAQEVKYENMEGDVLGSWLARVDYDAEDWTASIYWDHFFEDHSAMFHLDYDGYGSGADWNRNVDNRYLLYGFKDMMLGLEWKTKKQQWLDNVVLEYLYTKYQSGPIYHDHTESISDHIGGADNYYNHSIWAGWQHWGQVMGNPLYLSPIYNDDGTIKVKNNRFVAYYLAFGGHPSNSLSYRCRVNWQDAMGTYRTPYNGYKRTLNLMAEATYSFSSKSLKGWWTTVAVGMDRGNVHGNNTGVQLTLGRKIICKKDRR